MKRTPWWFVIVILVSMLPAVVMMPAASHVLKEYTGGESGFMSWLFPGYMVLSGICAYLCYPERRTLAWIMVVLMLLACAMLYICQTNVS